MNYVSVCSGIEAATVAWEPLGWRALLYAEIEKFPSRVLAHHYPQVKNVGDFQTITPAVLPAGASCDLLVGGTPCQAFSVAGLRAGLSDARGNLALEFMRLADRLRPRWILWENVPGVLSSNGGRDFGSILGALGELGYGFAWRMLDAQFVGVPQQRRRVFLVGYLGDWRRATAALFERTSVRRDTPPRGAAREKASGAVAPGASGRGELRAFHVMPESGQGADLRAFEISIAPSITTEEAKMIDRGTRVLHPVTYLGTAEGGDDLPFLTASNLAKASNNQQPLVRHGFRVRRLTLPECERLQGFPVGYTAIEGGSDTARYKALGNTMAIPPMHWIGRRIELIDRYAHRFA